MKKFLFFMIMAIFCLNNLWSQTWIGLTSLKPAEPKVSVVRSDNEQVTFTVTLYGFFSTAKTEAGVNYQRLSIPGCGAIGIVGEPEIPVILKRIAVPVCEKINYSVQISESQILSGYHVYPVPEMQPNNLGILEEVFTINSLAYQQNNLTPAENYVIKETGSLRSQQYITLEIHPIRFNPVSGQLQIATEMEVTLSFANPSTDVNVNVGIFNNVATNTFINYEDNGIKASVNDKAFEKEGFIPGNVEWITLTDTAQAKNIVADYLIICAEPFFEPDNPASEVLRLAQHRANYNGFDVAIINVEDIISDATGFFYEGNPVDPLDWDKYKTEQRIRTCIRRIYEGQHAEHTLDGHLGYVLLIGDVDADNTGMPSSFEIKFGPENKWVSSYDYYFSCVTKNGTIYDPVGDLYIGRFCIPNNDNPNDGMQKLYNMVEKTINYEKIYSFDDWHNNVNLAIGDSFHDDYLDIYYPILLQLFDEQNLYAINSYDSIGDNMADYVQTLIEMIDNGASYLGVFTHGDTDTWLFSDKYYYLTAQYLMDHLNNNNKPPLCVTHACLVGNMHDNIPCLAEQMTNYSHNKGFAAMIALSTSGYANPSYPINLDIGYLIPESIYHHFSHIMGEIFLEAIINVQTVKGAFILFGDPALNIMAEGYEITQNVTVGCPAEINCHIRIHDGATLTIPNNCVFSFQQKGKITVETDGNLIIGQGAQMVAKKNQVDTVIHIKGGEFILEENVIFNNLNGGIVLENAQNDPTFLDGNKQYDLNNITFNNTPLKHSGSRLNISNCTFNQGSDVITSISISTIDSCIFNKTTFLSDQANQSFFRSSAVSNCNFTGNNSNTALQINNSSLLEINNNIIIGYDKGINLISSGIMTEYYHGAKLFSVIRDNIISNCSSGIELYNSIVNVSNNVMVNSNYGVKLFNNSSTSFKGFETPSLQPQIIQDNNSYELYASQYSFPAIFRFNKVIDEDNLGNSFDDPMIYWDFDNGRFSSSTVLDVKFNCWGTNFEPLENLYPSLYYNCDSIWCSGKSISLTSTEDEILYQSALSYFAEEDFTNAELTFKELIETYHESRFAIAALHELFALEHFTNNDFYQLSSYYYTFTPEDSVLFPVADFLATRCNVQEKNWQPAVDWYEDRIINPPSYQDSVFAVIDLGDIHLMMEADTTGGGAKGGYVYYSMPQLKPESKQEYETTKSTLLATLPQKIAKSTNPTPHTSHLTPHTYKKGSLSQNIPNPATKSTIIPYQIYEDGAIEIKLYNIYGQLLKTLHIGTHKQGNYQIEVSLAGYSAGMYQYVLYINGEKTDTKKMIVN